MSQAPGLHFLMRMQFQVAPPQEHGESFGNTRRAIAITGGSFEGPTMRGEVLPGGADWQYTRPDGVVVLEARYALKTVEGEIITILNRGFRHGLPNLATRLASGEAVASSQYYFMTTPLLESSSPRLQWLSRAIFLGQGERQRRLVVVDVWQVGDRRFLDLAST